MHDGWCWCNDDELERCNHDSGTQTPALFSSVQQWWLQQHAHEQQQYASFFSTNTVSGDMVNAWHCWLCLLAKLHLDSALSIPLTAFRIATQGKVSLYSTKLVSWEIYKQCQAENAHKNVGAFNYNWLSSASFQWSNADCTDGISHSVSWAKEIV